MCLQSYRGAVITDWVILVLVFCFSLHVKWQQFKVFGSIQMCLRFLWDLVPVVKFQKFSKIFQNQGLCLKSQMSNPDSHQKRMRCISAPKCPSVIWMPPAKIPKKHNIFFWLYTMTITWHSAIGGWLGVSERSSYTADPFCGFKLVLWLLTLTQIAERCLFEIETCSKWSISLYQ